MTKPNDFSVAGPRIGGPRLEDAPEAALPTVEQRKVGRRLKVERLRTTLFRIRTKEKGGGAAAVCKCDRLVVLCAEAELIDEAKECEITYQVAQPACVGAIACAKE